MKMNRTIMLFQVIAVALFFASFVFKINNIFLLLGLLITYVYIRKYRKFYNENKDTLIFTIVFFISFLAIYYLLGLFGAFENNYASIQDIYIIKILKNICFTYFSICINLNSFISKKF